MYNRRLILPWGVFVKRIHHTLLAVSVLLLAACGGGGGGGNGAVDPPDPTFDQGILGFVHTIADAPAIAVGLASTSAGLSSLAVSYGQRVLQARTVAGFDVEVAYADGNGDSVSLLSRSGADNIKLFRDDETIVWLTGTVAAPTVVIVENEEYRYGVATGTVAAPQVQLFHGASGEGDLDVYLTAAADDITAATPVATLTRNGFSPLIGTTARTDARFRVTPAGDNTTVIYDSGTFEITDNSRTHVFITDYFGPGGNRVTMRPIRNNTELVFDGEATSTELRLTNLVADVTTVEAHIGTPAGAPLLSGVAFRGTGAAGGVPVQNAVNIVVTADGVDTDEVFDGTINVLPGTFVLGFVGGLLTDAAQNEDANTSGGLINTEIRRIATGVQVQYFHGSPAAGTVDVYLLPVGQTTADNNPDFTLGLGNQNSTLEPAADYDLVLTETGSNTAIFGPERVTLALGSYYTVAISDAPGGGAPFSVTVEPTAIQ